MEKFSLQSKIKHRMTNSVDPDETALGSTLFAQVSVLIC